MKRILLCLLFAGCANGQYTGPQVGFTLGFNGISIGATLGGVAGGATAPEFPLPKPSGK